MPKFLGLQLVYASANPYRNECKASLRASEFSGAPMNTDHRNATCASFGSLGSNLISGRIAGSGRVCTEGTAFWLPPEPLEGAEDDAPLEILDPAVFSPPDVPSVVASRAFSTAALTCARPFLRKFIAAGRRRGHPHATPGDPQPTRTSPMPEAI